MVENKQAARCPLREMNSPASCFLMFVFCHVEKMRNNLLKVEEKRVELLALSRINR